MATDRNALTLDLYPALTRLVNHARHTHLKTTPALLHHLVGDPVAAIMLRHLVEGWPQPQKPGGWLHRSAPDWFSECALTESMVKRIHRTRLLEAIGVERKVMKADGSPTNHYRLNPERFIAALAALLQTTPQQVCTWMGLDTPEPLVAGSQAAAATTTKTAAFRPDTPEQETPFGTITPEQNTSTRPDAPQRETPFGTNAPEQEIPTRPHQPGEFSPFDPVENAETYKQDSLTDSLKNLLSVVVDSETTKTTTNNYIPAQNAETDHEIDSFTAENAETDSDPAQTALPRTLLPGLTERERAAFEARHGAPTVEHLIRYALSQPSIHTPAAFVKARLKESRVNLTYFPLTASARSQTAALNPALSDFSPEALRYITGPYAAFITYEPEALQ